MNLTIDNEFKTLIPELSIDELEKLKESILENGIQQPLSVWNKDGELILIDGHHRYEIAQENDLEFKTIEFEFENRNQVLLWIIDNQIARRNLKSFVKYELANKYIEIAKEEAKEQQRQASVENMRKINEEKWGVTDNYRVAHNCGRHEETQTTAIFEQPGIIENTVETAVLKEVEELIPEPEYKSVESIKEDRSQRTDHKVAKLIGVSHNTVAKMNVIDKKATEEVKEQLRTGDLSIDKAYKDIKNEEKKAEWQEKVDKQKEEIANNNYLPPAGKYDVIAIDPPWNYKTKYDDNYGTGQVACPYPEMSQEELKKLPLPDYCADDCCLFLWTTQRFLPDALELMAHWGFKYKNYWIWNKDRMGLGEFYQIQTEICLVGFKGKPQWRKDNHGVRDYALEHIRQHSRKPEAFYEMVDKRFAGYKLEWFSRTEREGWVAVGNDTQKFN